MVRATAAAALLSLSLSVTAETTIHDTIARFYTDRHPSRCVRVHELGIEPVAAGEQRVMAGVRAIVTKWSDMPGGNAWLETLHATVTLDRGGDGWQIVAVRSREEELADTIAAMRSHEARAAMLASCGELRTPALAGALSMHALRLLNQQRFVESRELLAFASDVAHETADDAAMAVSLMVRSALEDREQRNSAAAIATAEEAVAAAERSGNPDALAWALVRHGRAVDEKHVGDGAPDFLRVLSIADFVENPAIPARAATQLANITDRQRRHRDALRYSELAWRYSQQTDDPAARISALMNLGGAYAMQYDYELAVMHLEEAVRAARAASFHRTVRDILTQLAYCHLRLGDPHAALRATNEALAIEPESRPPRLVLHQADIHEALGDEAGYEAWTEAAWRDRNLHMDEQSQTEITNALVALRTRQGRLAEALALADGISCRITDPSLRSTIDARLASILRHMGRPWDARHLIERRIDTEHDRDRAFGTPWQQMLLSDVYVPLYLGYADLLIDLGDARAAYAAAQQFRARTLVEAVTREHPPITAVMNAAELQEFRRRDRRVVELNKAIAAAGANAPKLAALREELAGARLSLADFSARVRGAQDNAYFAAATAPPPEDPPPVPEGIAVVEYMVTEERTIAFTLTRGSGGATVVRSVIVPVARKELQQRVDDLVARIGRRDQGYGPAARRLYDLLLRPVAADIAGRTLCIVPHQDLWRLPFHALQRPDGRHVAEVHPLFYAPSAAMLAGMRREREPAAELLAIANPSIDARTVSEYRSRHRSATLGPLPDSETEVRALARLYGANSRVYIRDRAREATFKREAGRYRVLHIATHGVLDGKSPMFSSLVLAAGKQDLDEDGLLEAREIANLRLSADVAVLAACDTARGRVTPGEGMIGMSWALLVAGCPNAVVSQWKAESAATAALMIEFHRRLIAGGTIAEAMQLAQRSLLRQRRYAHPFYWAPFVVVGSGRPAAPASR